jgi:hypothetical protein
MVDIRSTRRSTMGLQKHQLAVQEGQEDQARAIAVKAGCIEECEDHGFFMDTDEDPAEAYRLGNTMITNGEPGVSSFDGDRRLMTDTIKDVLEQTGESCPGCDSRDRD